MTHARTGTPVAATSRQSCIEAEDAASPLERRPRGVARAQTFMDARNTSVYSQVSGRAFARDRLHVQIEKARLQSRSVSACGQNRA